MGLDERMVPDALVFSRIDKITQALWSMSVQRTVGDGTRIPLWHHDWGWGILRHRLPDLYSFTTNRAITQREAKGNDHFFRPTLSDLALEQLVSLQDMLHQTILVQGPDNANWKWTEGGRFKVNSAYRVLQDRPTVRSNMHKI